MSSSQTPEQRRRNLRSAWLLVAFVVALVVAFFISMSLRSVS